MLPTAESIAEANTNLLVLYSFLETVSPTKTALKKNLTDLDAEFASSANRRAEQQVKSKRAPVATEMSKLGMDELKVLTKAREYYKGVLEVGGVPQPLPRRYVPAMKQ